jgi:hypothetical protein
MLNVLFQNANRGHSLLSSRLALFMVRCPLKSMSREAAKVILIIDAR